MAPFPSAGTHTGVRFPLRSKLASICASLLNVRELENTIKRLLVLSPAGVISAEDARGAIGGEPRPETPGDTDLEARRLLLAMLGDDGDFSGNIHREIIGKLERQLIGIVLERTGGNAKRAAEILGINRNTLSKKISGGGAEKTGDQ